jgi:hypothetical protein
VPGNDPSAFHRFYVATADGIARKGGIYSDIRLPYAKPDHCDAVGSLYHFTADLSACTLRVRPVIPRSQQSETERPIPTRTEWIVAEDIAGLAEYRVAVAMCQGSCSCTLIVS